MSHHSTEDLAIMRALPEMVVVAPCDIPEAVAAAKAMIAHQGPVYYRCGYKDKPPVHDGPIDFQLGRAITVREGGDAAVIFSGTIGYNAKLAVEKLASRGIACRLVSMPTVKPIDQQAILEAAKTGTIVTVEEHNVNGGLGSRGRGAHGPRGRQRPLQADCTPRRKRLPGRLARVAPHALRHVARGDRRDHREYPERKTEIGTTRGTMPCPH